MRRLVIIDHGRAHSGGQEGLVVFVQSVCQADPELALCAILDKQNHQLRASLTASGVTCEAVDFTSPMPVRALAIWRAVRRLAHRRSGCVLYGNTFEGAFWSGICGRLLGIPSVFRMRLSPVLFSHGILDFLIVALNDLVIANSEFVRRGFVERFRTAVRARVHVAYVPVTFPATEESGSGRAAGAPLVVALVGRFEPIKRQRELVSLAAAIERARPGAVRFRLIGEPDVRDGGAYLNLVHQDIERERAGSFVQVVHGLQGPREVFRGVHACVTLSVSEALSRSMVEAAAFGIVNVAVNAGGSNEVVTHLRTGILVESHETTAMAKWLTRLADDDGLRQKLVEQARVDARSRFLAERSVEVELTVLRELVDARDGCTP